MRIAIYGKGGIGKSTLAANISAVFAESGRSVLQVGCDPKHDSTRLLLEGRRVDTVLDVLRSVPPDAQRLRDVLHTGYGGVHCVEAGGPEPGVGCAGRGILSTFELLASLGLDADAYDLVLYDVLGDVVCGGFAVPLRRGFADRVVIVTSEEFMSLYAANNILKGVRNFHGGEARVSGLILNSRGDGEPTERVERFAQAVGAPILAGIPRSDLFSRSEAVGQTIIQAFPQSAIAERLRRLAETLGNPEGAYAARPLEDEELEHLLLGRAVPGGAVRSAPSNSARDEARSHPRSLPHPFRFMSKSVRRREPLHGCAFAGAVATLTQIEDAITVAHGPRSCVHIAEQALLASGSRLMRETGHVVPQQLHPRLLSSDMGEEGMVFGGLDRLEGVLGEALASDPNAVFLTTTCPAGVIGDNVDEALQKPRSAGRAVVARIETDGDMAGDYLQGVINACLQGAGALIEDDCSIEEDLVNIVAEKNIATNAETNFARMEGLLGRLGLRVNCRFVRRTSVGRLRNFRKAPLNLLAYDDTLGRVLSDYLRDRAGAVFADVPFPVGLRETLRWLGKIGAAVNRADQAAAIGEELRDAYTGAAESLRPALEGRRMLIIAYNHDLDWIIETAFDVGVEVVKVGILNYSQDDLVRSRYRDRVPFETGYPVEQREQDIAELKPDLTLSNYVPHGLAPVCHYDSIPLCPDVGAEGALALARRWATLMKTPLLEGWRRDGAPGRTA
jgi:nitrogenase iron protein